MNYFQSLVYTWIPNWLYNFLYYSFLLLLGNISQNMTCSNLQKVYFLSYSFFFYFLELISTNAMKVTIYHIIFDYWCFYLITQQFFFFFSGQSVILKIRCCITRIWLLFLLALAHSMMDIPGHTCKWSQFKSSSSHSIRKSWRVGRWNILAYFLT